MVKKLTLICSFLFLLVFGYPLFSATSKQAILLDINGAISPATQDYVQRGIDYAHEHQAALIILRMDTPGGLESSMRGIDKAILASSVPVVAYVAPAGARAASAGTFILYASHVAAMAPGTNIGAASPINIGGMPSPSNTEKSTQPVQSTSEKKAMNDAAASIRSLAVLRGRNVAWGEKAVREAVSLSADEAYQQKVIDVIANSLPELLRAINGRTVKVQDTLQTLQTTDLTIEPMKPDWRFQFLSLITDPSIAYILLLIGVYGLFFEFSNPGFVLPGVAGGIALLLALYAFQLLPINYVGFALLLLGIAFMIFEIYVSSFGVLGIGGIIAFAIGSILLLDTHAPGFSIAWQLIFLMTLASAVFFFVIINLTLRSLRKTIVSGKEELIHSTGIVLECNGTELFVRVHGEIWAAHSAAPISVGEKIRVLKLSGLELTVEPIKDKT